MLINLVSCQFKCYNTTLTGMHWIDVMCSLTSADRLWFIDVKQSQKITVTDTVQSAKNWVADMLDKSMPQAAPAYASANVLYA